MKRPQDINNTQVISLIECKMAEGDIRFWAHQIYVLKLPPLMCNLLKWMYEEMTVQFRSGATICKTRSSNRPSVNSLVAVGNKNPSHDRKKPRHTATFGSQVTTLMSVPDSKQWHQVSTGKL